MHWTMIGSATDGRSDALNWIVWHATDHDDAALQTLLLLDASPHPAATLVAAATSPNRNTLLIHAALAPHVAATLAAWRADPQWVDRAGGAGGRGRLTWGVAVMSGALRADPAALRDAAAIVLRDGDSDAIVWLLESLGADGWRALEDDQRAALLTRAAPADLGLVWGALDEAQRATTTQRATSDPDAAAWLIGRIGAAAWRATDPALRERVITVVVRASNEIEWTAPAWPGMTDDERDALARAAIAHNNAGDAFWVLNHLGADGRGFLSASQRAALERRARDHPEAWRVLAWRAADIGRDALTAEERSAVLAAADQTPWNVPVLLRIVGAAGWNAMRADEQSRLAAMVRRTPDVFFRCPPTLWRDLAGDALPPATTIPWRAMDDWRAEDADADLGDLPPAHQAVVLAYAPWRREDAAPDSVRLRRLRVVWDAMTSDESVALAATHPSALSTAAAAAHLNGSAFAAVGANPLRCGAASVIAAVGETVARVAAATGSADDAARVVGVMLRSSDHWRDWMGAFAPTDAAPPEVGTAWVEAARRGWILDAAICARMAALQCGSAAARMLRRAGADETLHAQRRGLWTAPCGGARDHEGAGGFRLHRERRRSS